MEPTDTRWGGNANFPGDPSPGEEGRREYEAFYGRTRYESHAWDGNVECIACGVAWENCEGECPR